MAVCLYLYGSLSYHNSCLEVVCRSLKGRMYAHFVIESEWESEIVGDWERKRERLIFRSTGAAQLYTCRLLHFLNSERERERERELPKDERGDRADHSHCICCLMVNSLAAVSVYDCIFTSLLCDLVTGPLYRPSYLNPFIINYFRFRIAVSMVAQKPLGQGSACTQDYPIIIIQWLLQPIEWLLCLVKGIAVVAIQKFLPSEIVSSSISVSGF